MRLFMSNSCMHGNCKCVDCYSCKFFKPKFFEIPIPKKLAKYFYNIEYKMTLREINRIYKRGNK